jgi:hypothetical protein
MGPRRQSKGRRNPPLPPTAKTRNGEGAMQCNVIYRGDGPARRKGRKVPLVAAAHGEAVLGKLLRQ